MNNLITVERLDDDKETYWIEINLEGKEYGAAYSPELNPHMAMVASLNTIARKIKVKYHNEKFHQTKAQ